MEWEKGETQLNPHCDDPNCDLGFINYCCPECGSIETSYDAYMVLFNIYIGGILNLYCGKCGGELEMISKEYELIVRKRNEQNNN